LTIACTGHRRYPCITLSRPMIRETGLSLNIAGLTSGPSKDKTSLERAASSLLQLLRPLKGLLSASVAGQRR
jgi:hypothetical protein